MGKAADRRLYGALKRIRRRLLLRHFVRFIILGTVAALVQAAVWLGASFIVPIYYIWHKSAVCGAVTLMTSVLAGAVLRPSMRDAAREADRQGLQERAVTAYERMGLDDVFSVAQREDAINRLNEFDVSTIPVMPPKRWVYWGLAVSLLIFVGYILPNPQRDIVDRRIRVQKEIEEQAERLQERVWDNLAGEIDLSEEEKQELMKLIDQLADTLRQSRDYREVLKEISRAEQNLSDMTRRFQQTRMALLGSELEKHGLTGPLGQAIRAMDAQGIMNELGTLKKRLEQGDMVQEAMESLRRALEEAAKALPEGGLKQQLENVASVLASDIAGGMAGEKDDVREALDTLQEVLVDAVQGNVSNIADISFLLQSMKASIASAIGQDFRMVQRDMSYGSGNQSGGNGDPDSQNRDGGSLDSQSSGGTGGESQHGSQGAEGTGNVSGGQDSEGFDNASGDHSSGSGFGNNSSGNGSQGTSDGGAGTGVGSGSTGQYAGYREGGSSQGYGQKGQGDPNSYGSYERIYDPSQLGSSGKGDNVAGTPTGQGTGEQVEIGPGIGSFDGFIPYNEVFGRYSRQAMENLNRMDIPPGMREMIKEYFSSLE
ncbi:MAG: apolipoprotein A1/A4/E family protein [Clostridiales bacterium]|nr:apolipoprotein A1/A4/E family protein [Clostridiales bacterium]